MPLLPSSGQLLVLLAAVLEQAHLLLHACHKQVCQALPLGSLLRRSELLKALLLQVHYHQQRPTEQHGFNDPGATPGMTAAIQQSMLLMTAVATDTSASARFNTEDNYLLLCFTTQCNPLD